MKFLGRSVHELVQKYVEFHISYTDFVDLRRVPILRPMRFAEIYSILCLVLYQRGTVLRYIPVVFIVGRLNIEDDKVGGYHWPKGTQFQILTSALMMRDDCWTDPEKFESDIFYKAINIYLKKTF
ncbi:unnamed protein product [Rhizophagus irregularis]|nr:unnamed protein product [Rhizophagus irregularis]